MNARRLLLTLTFLILACPVLARTSEQEHTLFELVEPASSSGRSGSTLSVGLFSDTVSYGGTFWAPDSMRWEAIRDSCWTFESGVGSSINTGANPNKPAGYHQTMEGWYGIDQTLNPQPYFRRSTTCAISGSFSVWAGVTLAEANPLCYAAGQGYGNSWDMFFCKTFIYPGAGTVAHLIHGNDFRKRFFCPDPGCEPPLKPRPGQLLVRSEFRWFLFRRGRPEPHGVRSFRVR